MTITGDVLFELDCARNSTESPFNNPAHPEHSATVSCVARLEEWLAIQSEQIPDMRTRKPKKRTTKII